VGGRRHIATVSVALRSTKGLMLFENPYIFLLSVSWGMLSMLKFPDWFPNSLAIPDPDLCEVGNMISFVQNVINNDHNDQQCGAASKYKEGGFTHPYCSRTCAQQAVALGSARTTPTQSPTSPAYNSNRYISPQFLDLCEVISTLFARSFLFKQLEYSRDVARTQKPLKATVSGTRIVARDVLRSILLNHTKICVRQV
jgi:hypothetical protein